MVRNLDIDLMRTFIAVADHASMTVAANARYLTQSAVSQQIKRLEEMLGQALFERDRRGLKLTPAGERLLTKGRRLIALNEDIWAEMADGHVGGKVRLGLPYDLVESPIVPVIKTYSAAYPQVEISLTCAASPDLIASLAAGAIDLAVVEEPQGPSDGECLRVERLVWVGARNGGAYLKTPLPVSMIANTCAFRPAVLAALAQKGRAWRSVFENENIQATTATVRADLAVTAWLVSTVPSDLEILGPGKAPTDLPFFSITLHHAKGAVAEMARHLRTAFVRANSGP
jgi:DNA-binding transcriptional LysR family regulator